jgi:HAD superfamily hydrolase (TIGR01549 family)
VRISTVVFDVGETLVDETRIWSDWADWLGVPRLTFLASFGSIIALGRNQRDVFEMFRPGIDIQEELRLRAAAGRRDDIMAEDLYPDAVPVLHALDAAGYRLGIAGNQPARAEQALRALGLPVSLVATSAGWGISKPDPRFFERVIQEVGRPAGEIAYVGDRLDNDVRPASQAGMVAVFLRRGPWAYLQAGTERPVEADLVIESLAELPESLQRLG